MTDSAQTSAPTDSVAPHLGLAPSAQVPPAAAPADAPAAAPDDDAPPATILSQPSISALFDALPLGLAVVDRAGIILRCNDAFAASFGITGTPAGQDPGKLLLEADHASLLAAIAHIYGGSRTITEMRLRLRTRPDEPAVLTVAATPRSAHPDGMAVMLAVRDIREQLRLEAQVQQVTRMQAVGQLAGGVAHDFNNVLTAVLGLCDQLLTRHLPGSSDFDDIDQIRQNANRAAALTRQLLAFARQQTLQVRLIDVADILGPLRNLLQRLAGPTVAIHIDYDHEHWAARVDPGQLEQVIVNLAVNARDAMPGGGLLNITTRAIRAASVGKLGHKVMPPVDYVAIGVRDTGTGIPPALAAKIFEPFFTTKPLGQGTGLGLSSVYGIVKQSGGFIFMRQPRGGGTAFDVYLPADGAVQPAHTPPAAAPAAALTGTVLLVEDERAVRMVVERALRHIGLAVHSAEDGAAALALLATLPEPVDLIISDVVMPGMDGIALTEAVRELHPDLRIILMSGYAEPPQRSAVSQRKVSFLSKPFAVAELTAAVRSALVG